MGRNRAPPEFVSIPFKRESVSKAHTYYCRPARDRVSIPFKRESVSKDLYQTVPTSKHEFQFPSNGKAYPKKVAKKRKRGCQKSVSIPFKRESVSKGATGIREQQQDCSWSFQFPSNGKAYPKGHHSLGATGGFGWVSIPFKRESVSKVGRCNRRIRRERRVSIPFKRESVSKVCTD